MVDVEPFLEAPFSEASNRSYTAVLLIGVGLLVTVGFLGRSTVTEILVAAYLVSIPGYIGYRAWVWDRAEASTDSGNDGDEDDTAEDETSDE